MGVGEHVRGGWVLTRIAHSPLVIVSGIDGSLIVVTTSTKGTSATADANRSGRIVTHGADEQPTSAATAERDPMRGRQPSSTSARNSDGVGERVDLVLEPAVEVPAPPSSPHPGDERAPTSNRGSSNESRATENHGGTLASYAP